MPFRPGKKEMPKPRNAVVMHARKRKGGVHRSQKPDEFDDELEDDKDAGTNMDDLISRAEAMLAFLTEEEIARIFHNQGIPDEDAFLAIKAAQVSVSPDKPVVH
jgi:uncharacterized protein (DUF2164 family)